MDRTKPILIAEDDPDDRYLLSKSFDEIMQPDKLHFVYNGLEVFNYLDGIPNDSELPGLIVLDINMPLLDGITALKILKKNPRYKHIPALMLTTSANPNEKERCMEIGAADYIIKPYSYAEAKIAARLLNSFVGLKLQ